MLKKLLDRFENSPKVWTIKEECDENGRNVYVTKIYDSIADAHRDNPKISCSHIEDYCNATFFTKKNHWFAYVGYRMAPSIDEMLKGYSLEPKNYTYMATRPGDEISRKPTGAVELDDTRNSDISYWSRDMWDDIATQFMGETFVDVKKYGTSSNGTYAKSLIAETLATLDRWSEIPKFMSGLYTYGWNKESLKRMAIDWCSKNLTRNKLLIRGYEPILTEKPEKRYWCEQSYKQVNYL